MSEIVVVKPKLHPAQQEVVDNASRFNILRNGRRWGKTKLGIRLACETLISGGSVGCFFPTFDFAEDFWDEIKDRTESITNYKSESKHIIQTITGGSLKIWSLEKARAGRGRKYNRAIIDEAAFAKDLRESWEKSIRATLTDLRGDAWFLSTPNGRKNHFHTLCQQAEKHSNWREFHLPSRTNPYLSQEELDEIKNQLDDLTWQQEFEAEFVDFTGRPFVYSFEPNRHVAKLGKPTISLPLDISFDFNVDPITAIVAQHSLDKKQIRIYKEFRLSNSDIYQLCDAIIAEYGSDFYFRVTGDASGNSRSAMVANNLNYYKIIIQKLKLERTQVLVPSVNPSHKNSRVLTNSLFKRHPDLLIDESCQFLVADNKYCETDENGEINKKQDAHKTHLLDCMRYYFNSYHSDFLKKYNQDSD
jgi:hypothetical protein